MTAYALAATVAAMAQSPEDPKAVPAYRKAAMHSMLDRIQKKHYNPKSINDSFSVAVFDRFLHTMDPNGYIFLEADVKLLEKYRLQVDDQLNASDPAFFEAAYEIYRRRTAEAEADYRQLIAGPFRFDKKEQVKHIRKNDPFPASAKDRKELWRKLLKYYVIRNYMDLAVAADSNAVNKPIDPAILAKAETKVKKYYDDFFTQAARQKSGEEKFEAYLNVVAMEFDAHTMYTGPKDRTFTEMLNKRFFGLGIELENRDGEYYVKRLMQGGHRLFQRAGERKRPHRSHRGRERRTAQHQRHVQHRSGGHDPRGKGHFREDAGAAGRRTGKNGGSEAGRSDRYRK